MGKKKIIFLIVFFMALSILVPRMDVNAASSNLQVLFNNNGNTVTSSNTINANFKVVNNGSSSINLADLKFRYYYTADSDTAQNFFCDHAGMLNKWTYTGVTDKVTGTFVKMRPSMSTADTYLEVGFKSGAGTLSAGGYIEIQTRVARTDWTNYDLSNDYSFKTLSTYGENDKIVAALSGTLINGHIDEDDITGPLITPTTKVYDKYYPTNFSVTLTPNGNTFKGITGLTPGIDYILSENIVTIQKSYFEKLPIGTKNLTFDFGAANNPTLTLTVKDTTPKPRFDAIIGTATGIPGDTVTVPISFKNVAKAGNVGACNFYIGYDNTLLEAVSVAPGAIVPNANINFSSKIDASKGKISFVFLDNTIGDEMIKTDGDFALITFKIKDTATITSTPLKFLPLEFDSGANMTDGNITITRPELEPQISRTSFSYLIYDESDIVVTLTPNGHTFLGIIGLTKGVDYTVSGDNVTILKSYLRKLPSGTVGLTFNFGVAKNPVLIITGNYCPCIAEVNIGTAKGALNDTVTVPITASTFRYLGGIGTFHFNVNYDKTLLEAVSVKPGNLIINPDINFSSRINTTTGSINVLYLDNTLDEEFINSDGVLLNITFKIIGEKDIIAPIVFGDYGIFGNRYMNNIGYISLKNGSVTIDVANIFDLSVGKVTGKEGETVAVPISFANVAKMGNVMSCDFKVNYDTKLLEAVSVEPGPIVTNAEANFSSYINTTGGAIGFVFVGSTAEDQTISKDGVFANINFKLKIPNYTQYTTPVQIKEIGAIIDPNFNKMLIRKTDGSVTIIRTTKPDPYIYYSKNFYVLGSADDFKVTLYENGNTFKGISGLSEGTDYLVDGSTVTILKSYLNSLEVGIKKKFTFDFGVGDRNPVLEITARAGKPVLTPNYKNVDLHVPANLVINITANGNTFKGIVGLKEGTDYIVSKNAVIILKSYLSTLTLGFNKLTFDFGMTDNPYLALPVNDSTPVETGLDVTIGTVEGKAGETVTVPIYYKDVAASGNVKESIFYIEYNPNLLEAVSIEPGPIASEEDKVIGDVMSEGMISMRNLNGNLITEDGVYANIIFRLKTPAVQKVTTPITFTLAASFIFYDEHMNEIEPVSRKAGSVTIDNSTSIEKAIYPTIADFDTYIPKDVAVTIMPNADSFKGIIGLIKDKDYTVSENTVTILKSYLSTLDNRTKKFTFDLGATDNPVLTINYHDSTPYNNTAKLFTVALGTVTGEAGDIVKVPITFSNVSQNGNVSYVEFCLKYDTDLLEPISVESGNIIKNANANFSSVINSLNGTISFVFFDNTLGNEQITGDGAFAYINFRLKNPIATPITTHMAYKNNPYFGDGDFKQITCLSNSGSITVNARVLIAPNIDITNTIFDKHNPTNVKVTLMPNGNVFKGITGLTEGTDFAVLGNTVTILASYLGSLESGTKTLSFDFGVTKNPVLNVKIIDTNVALDVRVGTAIGKAGEIVTVPVTFAGVSKVGNVGTCNFYIGYDKTQLEAVSVTAGDIITNAGVNFSSKIDSTRGVISFVFLDNTIGDELIKQDGLFAYINFKTVGYNSTVSSIKFKEGGAFGDGDFSKLENVRLQDGRITIF